MFSGVTIVKVNLDTSGMQNVSLASSVSISEEKKKERKKTKQKLGHKNPEIGQTVIL